MMTMHIRIVGAVLVLASVCAIAAETDQDAGHLVRGKLAEAKQDYITLSTFLEPPKGTPRTEVEDIYGPPSRVVEKAKGPAPYHVYDLGNDCSLDVAYENAKVKWARLRAAAFPNNADKPLPDSEQETLYRDGTAKLKEVRLSHWEAIRLASWNRR